jgi:3-deoxy-manno-octulosonate cytidylyltransferase (CMP-KDO synthetase)
MVKDSWVFIPARRASTRFFNKIMAPLQGKPLVMHVFDALCSHVSEGRVLILVDDEENQRALSQWTSHLLMTSQTCVNGTERCWDAAKRLGLGEDELILNIQGDEPMVEPAHLEALMKPLREHLGQSCVSTLVASGGSRGDLENPHRVKVLMGQEHRCLAFFRELPSFLDIRSPVAIHAGFYGYSVKTLKEYASWDVAPLEHKYKLEQYRFLEHQVPVYFSHSPSQTCSVDTPEDLEALKHFLESGLGQKPYTEDKGISQ